MQLEKIVQEFEIEGTIVDVSKFGTGHINSTYKVSTKELDFSDYILQSINTNVPELSSNIERVTIHIKSKLKGSYSPKELLRHSLTIIYANNGLGYFQDSEGVFWRMFSLFLHFA